MGRGLSFGFRKLMDFSRKKMPLSAASTMIQCPVRTVQPYALMLAPVYVFMKLNEKFVSVKAPMDYFVPEELIRLEGYEHFYMPPFVEGALAFRNAARRVKALLSWQPAERAGSKEATYREIPLPPTPYELSDAVLRIIGPLWGAGSMIEPYFTAVFANELCELLPADTLNRARDKNVAAFELAVMRSSWAVFLALLLGYCDLEFLNTIRNRVFQLSLKGESVGEPKNEIDELTAIVIAMLEDTATRFLSAEYFTGRPDRVSKRIAGRMERVKAQFIRQDLAVPSIFGPLGFVDV